MRNSLTDKKQAARPFRAWSLAGVLLEIGGVVRPQAGVGMPVVFSAKLTGRQMRIRRLWAQVQATIATLHAEEAGQDLVEYALVAVIIALAATAGMGSVAKEINEIFSTIAKRISGYGI